MKNATTAARMVVRACGTLALVLGLLFWLGDVRQLMPLHMLFGIIMVLAMWLLSALGFKAGVAPALLVATFLWSLLLADLGLMQTSLLTGPGEPHWLVQLLHLVIGMGGMAISEVLAGRIVPARASLGQARSSGA
jgi:hypothetical protein